ncbi:MAG: amidase [Chloroflexi bacterium]|nr:amidase [Chloroflexota bacterium]
MHDQTISELQHDIRTKQISPLELTRAYLDRIEMLNPKLNAFITLTAESALAEAQAATEAVMRGAELGPLHGIPLALKDLFDVRGVPTTAGSPLMKDNVARADAFVTKQLRDAGAIFLGKLNMHEWALGVTNINPHFGPVHNPWKLDHITGGSSGGSAAAIAAGLCAGTLGSDTGGSIRIPASLCGVVGLKPTYGRISTRGVIPLAWSLDHVGPIGRCVDDVALLFGVLDGYDEADPYCLPTQNPPRTTHHALRVGVPDAYFFSDLHPDTERAYRAAIKTIGELGYAPIEVALPGFEVSEKASSKILLADAAAYHQDRIAQHADRIGEDVLTRLRWGTEVSGIEYALARRTQIEWQRKLARLFETIDVLLVPATPQPATPIEDADPLALSKGNLTRFTRMFNLTGNPALVLPCGFTEDDLPIGLQLVGAHWREDLILQVARAYEQAAPWHLRTPQ